MRKEFDYWGVPFSELFPNYHTSHTVECDYEEKAKYIKNHRLYQCPTYGKKYTLFYGDYVLIGERGRKR